MPIDEPIGGRFHGPVYRVSGKRDVHDFLVRAVAASGGTVLYTSPSTRAPVFLGVRVAAGGRASRADPLRG